MTNKIYEMNQQDIQDFFDKYLPVKKIQKDKYGEVFTPPQLINQMLDLLPNNVWTNPKLTWLDPTAGVGNFLLLVYQRLMHGLSTCKPNIQLRSKHIIGTMLYAVEINKDNCKILKQLFGNNLHLFCQDFLNDNLSDFVSTFDCIVGNPPFQDDYTNKSEKRVIGGKSKLYERIFLKSYTLLKQNGYLTFITPDNIFSGNSSESYKTLIKNDISFVSFNSLNKTFFPTIQQDICYFLLSKHNQTNKTLIENTNGYKLHVKLQDRPVNPVRNWTTQTEKLINKYVSSERNNAIYNRGLNITSYKGNKYPIIYSPSKIIATNNEKLAVGLGIKKAIIFSISINLEFKMDYSGKYGIGPNTFYIPFTTNSQGKKLEKFLKSNDYKLLALATKTTRQFLKIAFIEHLKLTKIMGMGHNKTQKHTKTRKNITKRNY